MATYDIEALKADLPTAQALAQFVYDQTGLALNLVGRKKEDQYIAAKNALEGKVVPKEFITTDNPYVDKKEMIPVDEIKKVPPRSSDLPDPESQIHQFVATNMPHPQDPQSDHKVQICFRKYNNEMITYQILGPLVQQKVGTRINKFGQSVPERYSWMDPRTTELVVRNPDGTFTKDGRGLHTYCAGEKGAGIWALIDKHIFEATAKNITNPWD